MILEEHYNDKGAKPPRQRRQAFPSNKTNLKKKKLFFFSSGVLFWGINSSGQTITPNGDGNGPPNHHR